MFRICLCLVIAIAAAPVVAREVKLSSPHGGGCADSAAPVSESKQAAQPRATRSKPAPNETRAKPSVHSDAAPSGRLQSPRWHSFLPGMVR